MRLHRLFVAALSALMLTFTFVSVTLLPTEAMAVTKITFKASPVRVAAACKAAGGVETPAGSSSYGCTTECKGTTGNCTITCEKTTNQCEGVSPRIFEAARGLIGFLGGMAKEAGAAESLVGPAPSGPATPAPAASGGGFSPIVSNIQ